MPISVYELAAESKCKHKKERKKHYMDLFSKNFKTLWLIFFTSWVSCIPGQIVQLLGQLITMNFGFFLHSPLNAHDLHFLFLSLQADGKKVRQWKHKLTPKEFRESDFFNMSLWIIFPCFFWKKSIWQSFVRKATILPVILLCSFTSPFTYYQQ